MNRILFFTAMLRNFPLIATIFHKNLRNCFRSGKFFTCGILQHTDKHNKTNKFKSYFKFHTIFYCTLIKSIKYYII
ncbi:hypothetical protein CVS40_0093 [Lucilia cuprina]|nr:hypothetical protein CVS40_0093 [Lucilia cuprina]